jgi:hypothetical protein
VSIFIHLIMKRESPGADACRKIIDGIAV